MLTFFQQQQGEARSMKVGFIGLGIMGRPMAGHLLRGGHTLHIHSRGNPPPDLIEAGAVAGTSPRDVAERSDVVITMLPDTPDVEAVVFGADGIAEGLSPGKILIDMSSISPLATKTFARRLAGKGCDWLDAPVSGGDVGARNATLSIMVGGSVSAFDRVRPVLELMGKNITLVGGPGDGQTAKVANQIIVALTIEAVAEALLFASKAGANPARVRKALMGGFASSRILEVHGERMVARTFDPGFRIELHQKDLNLALQSARELQVSLPNTAATQELFNTCAAHGGSRWDHSAIVKALELMADHEIGSPVITTPTRS
jgi:2-hydroxy-3-oxopropionate reductase